MMHRMALFTALRFQSRERASSVFALMNALNVVKIYELIPTVITSLCKKHSSNVASDIAASSISRMAMRDWRIKRFDGVRDSEPSLNCKQSRRKFASQIRRGALCAHTTSACLLPLPIEKPSAFADGFSIGRGRRIRPRDPRF